MGRMTTFKRLSEVSHLGIAEFHILTKRVRDLEEFPNPIRSSLNSPKNLALHKAGNKDLVRGSVIAAVGFLSTKTPIGAPEFAWIAAIAVGALFLATGVREKLPLAAAVTKAARLRNQLEGSDGFLWRFRTLLEYRDSDGPIHIHVALMESCKASKLGTTRLSRLQLLHYWHFVSIVQSYLEMADGGLHDERLDPY
jgi:hypothetical protein